MTKIKATLPRMSRRYFEEYILSNSIQEFVEWCIKEKETYSEENFKVLLCSESIKCSELWLKMCENWSTSNLEPIASSSDPIYKTDEELIKSV